MIVLRIVNIIGYRFDADESQHLHVIWGWAHGLVQYRDLFDNHMPLFQIMLAPIFGLIGDRASDLCLMRFALLPMYFVAAWCIYRIGTLHTNATIKRATDNNDWRAALAFDARLLS